MVNRCFHWLGLCKEMIDGGWWHPARLKPSGWSGVPKAIAVRRFIAYIARNPHPTRHSVSRESARGSPVHLSHVRPVEGLWHQEGARQHPPVLLSGRQD